MSHKKSYKSVIWIITSRESRLIDRSLREWLKREAERTWNLTKWLTSYLSIHKVPSSIPSTEKETQW